MRISALILVTLLGGCGDSQPVSEGGVPADLAARDLVAPTTDSSGARDLLAPQDAAADQATPADAASASDFADAGGTDLAPESDGGALGPQPCQTDNDCRAFSSYCASTPCQCFALSQKADPMCMGVMVKCFANPCANKKALCGMPSHQCQLQ